MPDNGKGENGLKLVGARVFGVGKKKVSVQEAAQAFMGTTANAVAANWDEIKRSLREFGGDAVDKVDNDDLEQEVWLAVLSVSMQAVDNLLEKHRSRAVRNHVLQKLEAASDDQYAYKSVIDYNEQWHGALDDPAGNLRPWDAIAGRFCEKMGFHNVVEIGSEKFLSPIMLIGISQILMFQAGWWKAYLEKFKV